ncbi:hypothetical protein LSH36_353g09061 [Paralvinella palmiformis]|uniref:Uncharacterized protein n=1 Tax=Paralvinella palmiformis TaxID=53620 RepID=A0AAD9JG11_9ANNE|nr:hypothetical protein LSH36_353g09061 [Paralvinella palmiformis]
MTRSIELKRAEEVDLIRKNEEPFIFLQQGKELLQQAVTCYSKATKEALTHSELASAHKNCAKALVTLSYNEYDQGKIVENIQVLYHFSRALNSGLLSSFPDQWLNSLQDEYVNCFRNSLKICEQFDFRPKVTYLVKIERVIVDECFKFRCLTEICDSFLKIIVPLFGKKEYESVLVYTQECSTFLTEADQVAVTRRDKILLSEMKKSNNALKIQASAILKMFKGEKR